jgi:hypothetical protein
VLVKRALAWNGRVIAGRRVSGETVGRISLIFVENRVHKIKRSIW